MKRSRIKTITALTAMTILLGGCGEAPYTLTEGEEQLIVHYAAHVVSKFNTDQDKGLTYVKRDTGEGTSIAPEPESGAASIAPQGGEKTPVSSGEDDSLDPIVSLTDLFGNETLSISYKGSYLTQHYAENSYYAVDADQGQTYLVMKFEIANSSAADKEIDCLAKKPIYQVALEDGRKFTSELTLLMEDFSAYQAVIPAGGKQNAVLLFQIPDTYTEVSEFTLDVSVGKENYEIAL